MAWNYEKMPTLALKDLERETECAIIRAEVDENMERYKKFSNYLEEIREELKKREKERF